MGATPTYALPYPELDEPDDVPTDMRELATAVETAGPLGWWAGGTFTVPGQLAANVFSAAYGRVTARAGLVDEVYIGDYYGDATTPSIAFGRARDTWLRREAAGVLRAETHLVAVQQVQAFRGAAQQVALGSVNGNAGISFGLANDTVLYRSAANQLATDDAFLTRLDYLYPGANMSGVLPTLQSVNGVGAAIGWNLSGGNGEVDFWNTYAVHGATVPSFQFRQMTGAGTSAHCLSIGGDGRLSIGDPADVSLYRVTTGQLKVEAAQFLTSGDVFPGGILYGASNLIAANGTGAMVNIGWGQPGAGMAFGAAGDTNLYRAAAGQLKTDGSLIVGNQIIETGQPAGSSAFWTNVGTDSGWRFLVFNDGRLGWHTGANFGQPDTNLYRNAAQQLKTDGSLNVAGHTVVDANGTGGSRLYFGNAGDTSLYRGGAGQLQLDGRLHIGGTGGVPAVLKLGAGYDSTGFGNVGGDRGIFIGNTSNYPVGAAATGGHLFAVNGVLFWRGSSGTTTQIAPA